MSFSRKQILLRTFANIHPSGLEADQKVIAAHGCYAMTATTALTAQNTQRVYDIHHTPPPFVARQINACIDDVGVDVVKIGGSNSSPPCTQWMLTTSGMLASAATVKIVAKTLQERKESFELVLDPVCGMLSAVERP